MEKLSSAKIFFERARVKGSESNKDTVNGEEIKKDLQEATIRAYRRSMALWDQEVD